MCVRPDCPMKKIIAGIVLLVVLMSASLSLFAWAIFSGSIGSYSAVYSVRAGSFPVILAHGLGFMLVCLVLFSFVLTLLVRVSALGRQNREFWALSVTVFQNLESGIIILGQNGIIQFINKAAYSLLKKDPQVSLEQCALADIVSPVLEPIAEKLLSAVAAGESFLREFRVFLSEGVRCYRCSLNTVDAPGLGTVLFLSITDKTEEDEIRLKLSQQLEETHRYAMSKDNFFANMSHEIRTPINAILGMTYFAKMYVESDKCRDYIAKIENASELLLGVVNDILDFSKMKEHKFSLKPENFCLYDLRKILNDLFSLKAVQKGLDFHVSFDCPQDFSVFGDQFRLTQIFMNLVSNAIKFTDAGSVSVFLNHEIVGHDVILRCSVRDTGCGLSEDDMAKLFTDFEQFGKVLVKNHEGTGLGLAICKRLVELMHGVIWVDSTEGKGSAFHFVVVLKTPEPATEADDSELLPVVQRRSGIILVVEDNEINSEIAESLLAEAGFAVEHACDGLAALDVCRARGKSYYDMILMDIHMPRMNGYDAARILKTEIGIDCPILAVTATSEKDAEYEANREYISGFILKPYDPVIFRSMFRR